MEAAAHQLPRFVFGHSGGRLLLDSRPMERPGPWASTLAGHSASKTAASGGNRAPASLAPKGGLTYPRGSALSGIAASQPRLLPIDSHRVFYGEVRRGADPTCCTTRAARGSAARPGRTEPADSAPTDFIRTIIAEDMRTSSTAPGAFALRRSPRLPRSAMQVDLPEHGVAEEFGGSTTCALTTNPTSPPSTSRPSRRAFAGC